MELRELLGEFGYDAEGTPIITGSALCALEVGGCVWSMVMGWWCLVGVVFEVKNLSILMKYTNTHTHTRTSSQRSARSPS